MGLRDGLPVKWTEVVGYWMWGVKEPESISFHLLCFPPGTSNSPFLDHTLPLFLQGVFLRNLMQLLGDSVLNLNNKSTFSHGGWVWLFGVGLWWLQW